MKSDRVDRRLVSVRHVSGLVLRNIVSTSCHLRKKSIRKCFLKYQSFNSRGSETINLRENDYIIFYDEQLQNRKAFQAFSRNDFLPSILGPFFMSELKLARRKLGNMLKSIIARIIANKFCQNILFLLRLFTLILHL